MALLASTLFPSLASAGTRVVSRGQNLQAVLNAAVPGDVIVLEAGAEFVGNFTLPVKSGGAPIVIRSTPSTLLPSEGNRIQPEHAPLMAAIRSSNAAPALKTAPGAHHWEIRYVEFRANLNGYGDLIQIGDGSSSQNTLALVPYAITLSHVYVHGDPLYGQKRCIALNAAQVTIRDSYISDCKGVGVDAQAIGGWNGPGPYVIDNNYLEASGENILFGGSDPAITNLVADNVTVTRNYVSRPLSWRNPIIPAPVSVTATAQAGGTLPAGVYAYRVYARRSVGQGTIGRSSPSAEVRATIGGGGAAVRIDWAPVPDATEYRIHGRTPGGLSMYWTVKTTTFLDTGSTGTSGSAPLSAGTVWSVKNLFELKAARNVVVEGNVFENNWKESQPGYAIVLTPRNSGGKCPGCVIENVRIESNVIRHVAAGFNILGYDNARPTKQTAGIIIRNNLVYDMGTPYGGNGWFLLIGDQPRDIVIDHNTISSDGNAIIFIYGGSKTSPEIITGVRITNNAARHNAYGINGEFFSYGNGIIQGFLPGATVTGNLFAGGSASRYPSGNRVSGNFEQEFANVAGGDFRLRSTSQLRGTATDGRDIGADMGTLSELTLNVESGLRPKPVVSVPVGLRILSSR